MRVKTLCSIIVFVVSFVFLPLMATAAPVPWSSESYTAYAYANMGVWGMWCDDYSCYPTINIMDEADEYTSESFFPISASASAHFMGEESNAFSEITYSTMNVYAQAFSGYNDEFWLLYGRAVGDAQFKGTFTANAPLLNFTYSLSSNNNKPSAAGGWIYVDDLTEGIELFSFSFAPSIPSTVALSIPIGHEIEFYIEGWADTSVYYYDISDATLTYSTSLVPEPISSLLFLAGGATLALRRYWRKKFRVRG